MLFCSWPFARFFAVVFTVYWLVPWRRLRCTVPLPGRGSVPRRKWVLTGDEMRVWLLLAASFYFYASWNAWLALLICATTLMDYGIGLALEAVAGPRRRRGLLLLSLVANLGVLVYFKYANFFLGSLEAALHAAGVSASMPVLRVILPVGISFYTFEAINYTVDVYRRKVPAERNPAHLLFFVLFFPHLVAGPIVRARDFLPQIRRRKRFSWARVQLGAEYFLLGLMKKWVVADQLAAFADPVFANPAAFGTKANWLGLLAFTVQVYCDIAGYSDMALGLAHMLGYKLAVNFNMPYVATSITDYWRRDHISLSTWLRDYLFIPLGGSRGSGWKTSRNFMITLTLGGLWHGASWNFLVWGALHGVYLSANRIFREFCEARPRLDAWMQTGLGSALRRGLTFFCVYQGFVLFRAPTWDIARAMWHRLWVPVHGPAVVHPSGHGFFGCILLGVFVAHLAGYFRWWEKLERRLPTLAVSGSYVLALLLCMILAPTTEKQFIYFQF
jgi:alginate O-acetyltransferase complex protein AlgI